MSEPVIPVPKDKDIDAGDLLASVSAELLENRKKELSSQVTRLFYKADELARNKRKAEHEAKKLGDKLDKVLARIERLKQGDWSVLKEKEDDKEDKQQQN